MNRSLYVILTLLFLALIIIISLSTGPADITVFQWLSEDTSVLQSDVMRFRATRVIIAFFVGGGLAFSGYLQQLLVNNPLADPYILGTASGASLGANFSYLILPSFASQLFIPSAFAFAGATLVTLTAFLIGAGKNGELYPSRLLLAGIALSSFVLAVNSLMIFLSGAQDKVARVVYWSMGNLELGTPGQAWLLAAALILVLIPFTFMFKHLNLLLLGKERAETLGLNVRVLRWVVLAVSSLIAALAVAVAGPVGFVGLVVPHVVRAGLGVHGKNNLIMSVTAGGGFLLFCDTVSRWLLTGEVIPVGIITSFLGIPFFVYLLFKSNYRFG